MSSGIRHLGAAPQDPRSSPKPPATDSDASVESNSLSQDSNADLTTKPSQNAGKPRSGGGGSEWEILGGLKEGQRYDKRPQPFCGYLHKKRKWPLKGWHKRYFVVEKGILVYGKSPGDVSRGKLHGSVDIGLSVISTKLKRKRLDIDAEEFIYHLKAKQQDVFLEWVEQLKRHRLYRQHVLTYGTRDSAQTHSNISITRNCADAGMSPLRFQWMLDNGAVSKELNHAQQALNQLERILEQLEAAQVSAGGLSASNTSAADLEAYPTPDGFSPNVKKDRRKFGLRKKKASGKGSSVDLSASPNRCDDFLALAQVGKDQMTHTTSDNQLCSDFLILAKDIYRGLRGVAYSMEEKAKEESGSGGVVSLRTALANAVGTNRQLKARLQAIHRQSDLSTMPLGSSLSYSSSCVSEFYDAEESLEGTTAPDCGGGGSGSVGGCQQQPSETSSVAGSVTSEEGSVSSEASELGSEYTPAHATHFYMGETGRRSKLPAPRPNTEGLSLWNLLTKNIGKDLSQVSMPVALNEPLNMLQRLCEELEYSELLDKAAELSDPYERMVMVAAFAVSAYGSSHYRAGSKPFNPLLGETYECVREDRGFRFIAEQVSHHPAVSACFAESKNFVFWQDARIKTKFWGKSMEFQPNGYVNVKLERAGGSGADLYRWNKVTTCVHNLFSAQRWVDQYGELTIDSDNIVCKLTFVKASYWSAKRHEIYGVVLDQKEGKVVRNLFGKWNEALYCGVAPSAKCIWRPGTMPEDYELYYGFTRFAMELNELDQDSAKYLPITDTRFRPDQRLLEEGKLEQAEETKMQLEQAQRERRKEMEGEGKAHEPRWFRKVVSPSGEETWEYTHKYWEARKSPGFVNAAMESLW